MTFSRPKYQSRGQDKREVCALAYALNINHYAKMRLLIIMSAM